MNHLLRTLGLLWSLPNTLIGLLLALPYGARRFSVRDWALIATTKRAIGSPGAQTWGVVIFAVGDESRQRIDEGAKLWIHERHHVRQGLRWGPIFLATYGLEWLARFVFAPGCVPVEWLEPTYWERRGYSKEAAKKRAARRGARWFRAYWCLTWERAARRAAGQRAFA